MTYKHTHQGNLMQNTWFIIFWLINIKFQGRPMGCGEPIKINYNQSYINSHWCTEWKTNSKVTLSEYKFVNIYLLCQLLFPNSKAATLLGDCVIQIFLRREQQLLVITCRLKHLILWTPNVCLFCMINMALKWSISGIHRSNITREE